ncbi:hypothetical protein AtNW77_Chr3g0204241 [Arabidopsis thaliana]
MMRSSMFCSGGRLGQYDSMFKLAVFTNVDIFLSLVYKCQGGGELRKCKLAHRWPL